MASPRDTRSPAGPTTEPWSREWIEEFLICPACSGSALLRKELGVECSSCGHTIELTDSGILSNLEETLEEPPTGNAFEDVRRKVRRFYESNPFPNYNGYESVGDLLARASQGVYAEMLDRQVPIGARVLEIGCGTGQLGLYLSVGGRPVVSVDMTRASLELAAKFRNSQRLNDCNFLQANLFELPLKPESFDLVICKGVLMATPDAHRGFEAVCKMIKPGGHIILGLYNRFGRLPTTIRGLYFRTLGARPKKVDYILKELAHSEEKARSWFLDQYHHPQETRHSVDQLLGWFEERGIDYVNAAPPIRLGQPFSANTLLFEDSDPGGRFEHWLVQLSWMFTIGREGALFDMIGRKR